ncbi:magnesium transporter [Anaerolineae bacterium CFX9]|jgi:magnesium transporter|nr:magnesium transporter [Anaerolineae bacterium CFX9]
MLTEQLSHIRELLEQRDWVRIRESVDGVPAPELAELLFEIDTPDRMILFRLLPRDISSEVFSLLESEQQNTLLKELTQEETRRLLSEMSTDDRVNLLIELPGNVTQKLLNLLSPEDLRETRQILGYPEESVGRLMTPDYVAVRPEWTIEQALQHIRTKGRDSETIDVLYVVDRSWKLLDALDLRRFILADSSSTVADIMDHQYIYLEASQDREEAVRTMERYDLPVLPVVDSSGVLIGIVTFDDVLDVAQAEATEDFHKGAAITPLKGSYREARFPQLYRKRIGWLLALVFANIFSGAAIANFEDTIAANVALVFFLPLLIDSSGNAGSQASTLMVRALAMGDVKVSDWWYFLRKEIFIAGALGATMAVAVSLIGVVRAGIEIALVVALTMALVVVVGSVIGTALPFLLSRLKFDPATASAPLITSLSDISGVLIYFSIASFVLSRVN